MPETDRAGDAAAAAAEALAPEGGLIADLDPINLANTLAHAAVGLAAHPVRVAEAGLRFGSGILHAATRSLSAVAGSVEPVIEPAADDRRFADRTWRENALYLWYLQRHLLFEELIDDLVDAADLNGPDGAKLDFISDIVVNAVSPTNFLWSNPTAVKRAFETGGRSLARGLRNMAGDVKNNGGWPRQVDASSFELGVNVAATPGQVVYRNELMELIQYEPQTEKVRAVPILCSPPWINKYYVMDLAPGRSFIEWAVQHGHTVFAISYRNPDSSMSGVTLEDYLVHGPRTALDVIRDITGTEKVNLVALCLGGTLTMMLLGYLAAIGDSTVRSVTLLNTMVDFSEPGQLGAFTDESSIERLEHRLQRDGVLPADNMRRTFDLLRPNDLVFNYVARNWLMGEDPPVFDILAWNEDSTNLPAAMHSLYLRSCYLENRLARNEMEVLGERIDLSAVTADVFIVGAVNDHIVPWKSSYRTTQLMPDADVTYVLSSAGHIAGIVNPPGPKASFRSQPANPEDADEWLAGTCDERRSWWELWAEWADKRGGRLRNARDLGSEAHPPIGDAPGAYVRG